MATQPDSPRGRKSQASLSEPHSRETATFAAGDGAPEQNPLSEREMDVAALLATGASNAEIARELVISPHTVKVHLRNIFEKLQVNSRTEATLVLLQRGWLSVPGVEVPEAPPEVALPEPEPEPWADLQPGPAPWQRIGFAVAALLAVLLLAAPTLLTRPKTSFTLLSDAGQVTAGQLTPDALARWEARAPLAQARSRHCAVLLDGEIFVLGGENAQGQTMSAVDAYDLRFNSWRSRASLPEPLANLAATALNGRIYVAGGSANRTDVEGEIVLSDRLYALDPAQERWESVGVLPSQLAGASLVAAGDFLYLLGGWDGERMRDEVWRTQPQAGAEAGDAAGAPLRWELAARLNTPASFFGAVVVNNSLYVVGGYDGQRALAEAAALDLTTGEWQRLPSMSTPRSGLTAIYDGMAIFALGGGWTKAIDTHERYDAFANQWSNFPSPFRGEWRHLGAAALDGHIWLIGGWSGGYLDAYQEYQSAFRALLPVIRGD